MNDAQEGMPDFAALYDLYFSTVYNYIRYRVEDASATDDVAGRVFEKALASLPAFDPARGNAKSWLYAIARNAVADHFRSQRWFSWLPFDVFSAIPEREAKNEDVLAAEESRRELLEALAVLGERERELVALKFGAGMNNRAIAKQTGMGESNVGVTLHRTLKKIKMALEKKS
jgi:RNA polymerase sigma-70 factor (ECF subfamily)